MQSVAQSLREAPVIKGFAPMREVPTAADPTGPADPRDALRNLAPAARTPVEVAVAEPGASRVPELPLQQAGNQSSQPVISTPSNVYSVTQGNPASAPAITQTPLPSGLETMNLARGADAAEWGNGLSERVSWMINQKQNSATIRLDPPMLGKLDVQVRIADDATTITIQTQHAQTRDLIETASLRLRDSLQENGFQNVNVDVSQRQDQQQSRSQTAGDEQSELHDEFERESESAMQHESHTRFFTGEGLLDTFA
jgi:flagellar hook-length control protein FliK